jgi:hypothetical protein
MPYGLKQMPTRNKQRKAPKRNFTLTDDNGRRVRGGTPSIEGPKLGKQPRRKAPKDQIMPINGPKGGSRKMPKSELMPMPVKPKRKAPKNAGPTPIKGPKGGSWTGRKPVINDPVVGKPKPKRKAPKAGGMIGIDGPKGGRMPKNPPSFNDPVVGKQRKRKAPKAGSGFGSIGGAVMFNKGGVVKANCGASMKPARKSKK